MIKVQDKRVDRMKMKHRHETRTLWLKPECIATTVRELTVPYSLTWAGEAYSLTVAGVVYTDRFDMCLVYDVVSGLSDVLDWMYAHGHRLTGYNKGDCVFDEQHYYNDRTQCLLVRGESFRLVRSLSDYEEVL